MAIMRATDALWALKEQRERFQKHTADAASGLGLGWLEQSAAPWFLLA